jgi:predicted RNase H-like HicB family nuclease
MKHPSGAPTMNFPIAIWGDASGYSVAVPDLQGCVSAGRNVDEAMANASEAIEFHLEGMLEDGTPIPKPASLEQHRRDPEYADALWAIVAVDVPKTAQKVNRLNITLPQRLVESVDRFAQQRGESRSGVLALAVSQYIAGRTPGPGGTQRSAAKRLRSGSRSQG